MMADDMHLSATIYISDANNDLVVYDTINTNQIFFGETNTGQYMVCLNMYGECTIAFALDASSKYYDFIDHHLFCEVNFFQDYISMRNEKENMFEDGMLCVQQNSDHEFTLIYMRENKILRRYNIFIFEDKYIFSEFAEFLYEFLEEFSAKNTKKNSTNTSNNTVKQTDYVDLGLPSGTLWKSSNEQGLYTYDEAIAKFGNKLPTKEQFEELKKYCTWTGENNGIRVRGQNGRFIYLSPTSSRACDGTYYPAKTGGNLLSSTLRRNTNPTLVEALNYGTSQDRVWVSGYYLCAKFEVRLVY